MDNIKENAFLKNQLSSWKRKAKSQWLNSSHPLEGILQKSWKSDDEVMGNKQHSSSGPINSWQSLV